MELTPKRFPKEGFVVSSFTSAVVFFTTFTKISDVCLNFGVHDFIEALRQFYYQKLVARQYVPVAEYIIQPVTKLFRVVNFNLYVPLPIIANCFFDIA